MGKVLVAYFSASGVTKKLAQELRDILQADLFEISPVVPYTNSDLNWNDSSSRSSVEMKDKASRPGIVSKVEDMSQYDTIFVGFPIWWYVAPHIINTFLESYDLKGKKIIPFATSGSSSMGGTNEELAPSCPGADLVDGRRFSARATREDLEQWVKSAV